MRKNLSPRGRRLSSFALYSVLPALAALLVFASPTGRTSNPPPSAAPAAEAEPAAQVLPRPWTALGSTGAIDESSINLYNTVSTEIGFRPNVSGNLLVARYNVTNTFDNNANPNRPGWTTLEMGSNAPLNVIIEAKLFRVNSCEPAQTLICTARNRSNDNPCARCQISEPIDFTKNLYYVEVTLNRTGAPAALPRMFTLRIF